jgi:hypothetical protein
MLTEGVGVGRPVPLRRGRDNCGWHDSGEYRFFPGSPAVAVPGNLHNANP